MDPSCDCDACDEKSDDLCGFCRTNCAGSLAVQRANPCWGLGSLLRYAIHRDRRRREEDEVDVPWGVVARTIRRAEDARLSASITLPMPPSFVPRRHDHLTAYDRARSAAYLTVLRYEIDDKTGNATPVYLGYHADLMPPGSPEIKLPTCEGCGGVRARCGCPRGVGHVNHFHDWPVRVAPREVPPELRADALAEWWRAAIGKKLAPSAPRLDPEHRCHAHGCTTSVPPEMLMCLQHWRLVPAPIRARLWKHYRPGQCDDKCPSREWHAAAVDAIRAVVSAERKLAPTPAPAGPSDFVVLDLETTGTNPARHHVLEVAAARLTPDAGTCVGRYAAKVLIPPRAEVEAAALARNGYDPLGDAWRRVARQLPEVVARLRPLLAGRPVIVAHNARFDVGFLRAAFARAGVAMPAFGGTLCTLALARRLRAAGRLPGVTLDALATHIGAVGAAHSAAGDVCRLVQVWWFLRDLETRVQAIQADLFAGTESRGVFAGVLRGW